MLFCCWFLYIAFSYVWASNIYSPWNLNSLFFFQICSLSTIVREYVAMRSISTLTFKDLILMAADTDNYTRDHAWKLSRPLADFIESNHNKSQLEAIHVSSETLLNFYNLHEFYFNHLMFTKSIMCSLIVLKNEMYMTCIWFFCFATGLLIELLLNLLIELLLNLFQAGLSRKPFVLIQVCLVPLCS